jgi:hypothetical protein
MESNQSDYEDVHFKILQDEKQKLPSTRYWVAITNNPAEMQIRVFIFQTVIFHGLKKSNLDLKTQAGLSKMNVP